MCVFIYTLSRCQHKQFQNVSPCPRARQIGGPDDNAAAATAAAVRHRGDQTVDKAVFLFDTSASRHDTPEYYRAAFPCRKLKATRPVPTLCDRCAGQEAANLAAAAAAATTTPVPGSSSSGSASSAGSSVGLAAGGGGSISDLTNESGTSGADGKNPAGGTVRPWWS